jgi:pyrimidine-nucleoside phosphorylase
VYNYGGDDMNIIDIINKKRLGKKLSYDELFYVVDGYMKDEIKDYQISALLMSICINGMEEEEIIYLTEIMLNSGEKFDLSTISGVKVDKHSTGGVGDKTTLVVAPLVASCGLVVSKMSGRGLGHTGGTIDKLESIRGFDVNLTDEEFLRQLNEIGVAITTSSVNIVPADKKLYALRDVTGTVSSIPLIASSIMSKKLATNADKIVLDVKVGSGALLQSKEEAVELAKVMIKIGKHFGKETVALITNMDYPLGNSIGNGLEAKEAIETLKGNGDLNFRELCITLSSYMVSIGKGINIDDARNMVISNLDNGIAYDKFQEMVKYQRGDINTIFVSPNSVEYKSRRAGYINNIDTLELGNYAMHLGAGRITKDDVINYGVGVVLNKTIGDFVEIGDTIATIYISGSNVDLTKLDDIFTIEENLKAKEPLIFGIVK